MLYCQHTPFSLLNGLRVVCLCQSASLARALFIFSFYLFCQVHKLLMAFHEILVTLHILFVDGFKPLSLGFDYCRKVFFCHAPPPIYTMVNRRLALALQYWP